MDKRGQTNRFQEEEKQPNKSKKNNKKHKNDQDTNNDDSSSDTDYKAKNLLNDWNFTIPDRKQR